MRTTLVSKETNSLVHFIQKPPHLPFLRHTDPPLGRVLPFLYHLHHTRLAIPLVGSENLACGVIRIELQCFV